jgi:hypothetical protein
VLIKTGGEAIRKRGVGRRIAPAMAQLVVAPRSKKRRAGEEGEHKCIAAAMNGRSSYSRTPIGCMQAWGPRCMQDGRIENVGGPHTRSNETASLAGHRFFAWGSRAYPEALPGSPPRRVSRTAATLATVRQPLLPPSTSPLPEEVVGMLVRPVMGGGGALFPSFSADPDGLGRRKSFKMCTGGGAGPLRRGPATADPA